MRARPFDDREIVDSVSSNDLVPLVSASDKDRVPQFIPAPLLTSIYAATTTLTAAQLAELDDTSIELVPAPGIGKVIIPIAVAAITGADTASLVIFNGDVGVYYDTDQDPLLHTGGSNIQLTYEWTTSSMFSYTSVEEFGFGGNSGRDLETVENKALTTLSTAQITVAGAIVTSAIGAAGTGYEADDEITIGDATLTVLTVDGGGEVLTYEVTDAGTTNIIGDGQATTTDSELGADFTLDITELDYSVNPMELKVKVLYSIFDLA